MIEPSFEKFLKQLSSQRLAAQCIMPKVEVSRYFQDVEYKDSIHALVRKGVTGFCVFEGELKEMLELSQKLQADATIPLIFSADIEYGLPMRIDGGTEFPHSMALGKANTPKITEHVARSIAKEAKVLGIQWSFSPVADVNNNPQNPIINIRSFGETPELVSAHSVAFINGTQSENVVACAKHFPGHGDTDTDSHLSLPTLSFSRERLNSMELTPFREAIAAGVQSIMTGHLAVPSLSGNNLPASLSREICTDVLRNELGFEGVIITDALEMNAITNDYSPEEAAEIAFHAGNDILLIPADPLKALDGLAQAVEAKRISRERLEESVSRILMLKAWSGLIDAGSPIASQPKKPSLPTPDWTSAEHHTVALQAAKASVQSFGEPLVPLTERKSVACFALITEKDMPQASMFFHYVARNFEGDCEFAFVDDSISNEDANQFAEAIEEIETVVLVLFSVVRAYENSCGLSPRFQEIAQQLTDGKRTVKVLCGSPYIQDTIPTDSTICTYSYSEASLAVAAALLATGEIPEAESAVPKE